MSKPLHWFIQKPQAHNCPYRTNGAVFQEFEPTIAEQGGEWVKVVEAKAYDAVMQDLEAMTDRAAINGKCGFQAQEMAKEIAVQLEECRKERDDFKRAFNELCYKSAADAERFASERDALAAQLAAAEKELIVERSCSFARDKRIERLERERDAYAKAMAHALRHGIYPNKQAVKEEIESILGLERGE